MASWNGCQTFVSLGTIKRVMFWCVLERGDAFYMVIEGQLQIIADNSNMVLGYINPGEFMGEISLVSEQPYSATAVAQTSAKVAALKYDDFENLINRYPRIGLKVMRNIAILLGHRMGEVNTRYLNSSK